MKSVLITVCLAFLTSLVSVQAGNACSSGVCGGDALDMPPTSVMIKDMEREKMGEYLGSRSYTPREKHVLRKLINQMKADALHARVQKRLDKKVKRQERKEKLKQLFTVKGGDDKLTEDELFALTYTRL